MGKKTIIKLPLPFQRRLEISTIPSENLYSETKCQKELQEPLLRCRYTIVFVMFLHFFLLNTYRVNMGVAIVSMVNNSAASQEIQASESCLSLMSNATPHGNAYLRANGKDGEYTWSPEIQGYVLGCYFVGYIISLTPSGRLVERFGCKWLLFWNDLLSAVITVLIPVISSISVHGLIAVLTLRGISQGIIQPSSSILSCNWFPKMERGFALSIINSGGAMGSCIGSLSAGFLCASLGGWPSSFYTYGSLGLVASASIVFFVYESPKDHPRISEAELRYILNDQEKSLTKRRPELPWRQILTSIPAYALAYALFGQVWAFSQFWTVYSTFLGTILHYPIAENGLLTAAPFLLQFVMAQFSSWLSSYMLQKNMTSIDFLRKFWNSMSCLGFSACQIGVYFSGCDRTLSTTFGILSLGFTGLALSGCWVVSSDMSPNFAATLNATSITVASISSFVVPLVVGYLTSEMQTIEQWNKVFFIAIGVVMSSGIVFAVFGSAEVQPWNCVEKESSEEKIAGQETRF